MKKEILLVLALGGLLTSLLVGQSPPPPPTPTVSAQYQDNAGDIKKTESETTNTPTQSATTVSNPASPKPAQKEVQSQGDKNNGGASFNWGRLNVFLLTLFNFVLALVGVFQLVAMNKQAGYMREALDVAKINADAAKVSADAATKAVQMSEQNCAELERAVVLLEKVEGLPQTGLAHPYFRANSTIVFTLKNYGRSLAKEIEVTGEVACEGITLDLSDQSPPSTEIAPQGVSEFFTSSIGQSGIKDEAITRLNQNKTYLTYILKVTYKDAYGARRYRATGEYVPTLRKFIIIGTS